VTWRGTLLVVLAGLLAVVLLLRASRTRTRSADRPLLDISPAAVTGMVIVNGASEIRLEKRDGVWTITSPVEDRADPLIVAQILHAAFSATPLDRLPPKELKDAVSLESLDLKPAKRSLTMLAPKPYVLKLGAEGAAKERLYAQVDSDPSVYLISSEPASLALVPAEKLRDRHPFASQPDRLSEIVLRRQGGSRQLSLRKTAKGWEMETPLHADADPKAVGDWITGILSSSITTWLPPETDAASCGLDTPDAVLTLREEGATAQTLEIGKETGTATGGRFARCSGRPGIFILQQCTGWIDAMPATLRSRRITRVTPDSVDKIVIRNGTSALELSRKPGTEDWLSGGDTIPGDIVTAWFGKLSALSASSFEPATPDHLATRGLNANGGGIRLVAHLSENTAEEAAGEITLLDLNTGAPCVDGTALRVGSSDDLMIGPSDIVQELLVGPKPPSPPTPTPAPAG